MIRGKTLLQVLGIYAATSWVVLQVVDLLRENMGLPDWVFPFALVLLLIGLPVLLATAVVQSRIASSAEAASNGEVNPEPVSEATSRLFTWRNAILGGVLAFSLMFGFAGLYVLIKEKAVAPREVVADTAVPAIAILPFTVRGEGLEVWSEGMVDVLATALDGVAGMRTISGRTAKAQWDEATAGGGSADRETALEVATAVGARYAVYGTAITSGSGMRIAADLFDVDSGEAVGHSQVEGPVDSIFPLVDAMSLDVLRVLGSGSGEQLPGVNLAGATTTSVDALRAYLEGEADYRRADFGPAIEHYLEAVEADSTFALAYYRLTSAYGWESGGSRTAEMRERLDRYSDRLPDRERILAQPDVYILEPAALEELRELVRQRPDDAEAWYRLGEVYFHEGEEIPVAVEETEHAFERAVALDPTFTPYRIHLIDLAMWFGRDSAGMASLLAEMPGIEQIETRTDILMQLAFGDESARDRALAALDTVSFDDYNSLNYPLRHPRYWPVYERYLEAGLRNADRFIQPGTTPEDMRRRYLSRLAWESLIHAGHLHEGLEWANDPLIEGDRSCLVYVASVQGMAVSQDLLDEALPEGAFCYDAYVADRGDTRVLDEEVARSRTEIDSLLAGGDSARAEYLRRDTDFLEGYGLWRSGRPAEALVLMEPNVGIWGGFSQLYLSQVYLELDRPRDAIRYLGSFGPDEVLPIADYWLGRAYEQAGESEKAASAYAAFLESWADPNPEAQQLIDHARALLQEIVRERG
jgi:tetratricopeptide (TPR) repeat protein/TolB-like protein